MTRCELIPSDVLDQVAAALEPAAYPAFGPREVARLALEDARFLESVEARRVRDALINRPHATELELLLLLSPVDMAVVRRVLALLKEPA